jgi:release factor glutamine methyltransferase
VQDILDRAQARLEAAGVDEARLKAEILISELLDVPRLELDHRARHDELPGLDDRALEQCLARLERREPLQYVMGHADFHGRRFAVDRRALVPRPETETLVDCVLQHPGLREIEQLFWADVGTGSGCIAVTLALALPGRGVAADSSADALALAMANARRHGVEERIRFTRGDLLDGVPAGSLHVVVSNPPYIPSAHVDGLQPEVSGYEPRLALDGGPDGLRVIERLVTQAFQALKPGGMLFTEVGAGQADAVKAMVRNAGYRDAASVRDLAGVERVVAGCKSS